MSDKQINTFVQVVDYLASSAAMTPHFGPVAMITIRDDPGNGRPHVDSTTQNAQTGDFRPHNLALTREQALRLRDDLNHLFQVVPAFRDPQEAEAEAPTKPKRRRRRGRRKNNDE